jgi:dTDP-glucose pyrophosphorylase
MMLNIVIPMAGAGLRFSQAGYAEPKPLISIHGTPMIRLVMDNLSCPGAARFIVICQRAHVAAHGLAAKLKAWAPDCILVQLDGLTAGAACTVLAAREFIDSEAPLMIANSDQYIDASIGTYLARMEKCRLDGLIMTMTASHPKWSYVGLDSDGLVNRVAEKDVISNEATVGVYNYRHGRDFVRAAQSMIAKNLRVNGEFYVAPAYNQLIAEGQRIGIHNIGGDGAGMHGLGIPDDLQRFLNSPVSRQAVEAIA